MSFKRPTTALLLASLLAPPAVMAAPTIAAEPANRAECQAMDPQNLTDFCRELHEMDLWRQQIMDDTGPTNPETEPVLVHTYIV